MNQIPEIEKRILKFWQDKKIFEKSIKLSQKASDKILKAGGKII